MGKMFLPTVNTILHIYILCTHTVTEVQIQPAHAVAVKKYTCFFRTLREWARKIFAPASIFHCVGYVCLAVAAASNPHFIHFTKRTNCKNQLREVLSNQRNGSISNILDLLCTHIYRAHIKIYSLLAIRCALYIHMNTSKRMFTLYYIWVLQCVYNIYYYKKRISFYFSSSAFRSIVENMN